ncbi:hypothetical protein H5410_060999 [Solanum commersonii]|uniref:Uncharacterized protein n=1 Tax=Solanum commersonii TaxID=4109 RepID=A0A9J5W6Y3_SOLCO|nr:hypothetical protein H5410_060999 [Solanum commersonii]
MRETVKQIKEQVINLARRPTTWAPEDTDDYSDDEDHYVDPTPCDVWTAYARLRQSLRGSLRTVDPSTCRGPSRGLVPLACGAKAWSTRALHG